MLTKRERPTGTRTTRAHLTAEEVRLLTLNVRELLRINAWLVS